MKTEGIFFVLIRCFIFLLLDFMKMKSGFIFIILDFILILIPLLPAKQQNDVQLQSNRAKEPKTDRTILIITKMMNELILNIAKIHTTRLGVERIKRNLSIANDVVSWCKSRITASERIERKGKNWYVYTDDAIITINAHSYTIITAHKIQ
ncbi:MAG: DUF3781 domain-containing protein [Bacteroidales bacterium]|nr:DUF3781 domain-containing protein [Bacteroidales bacterium]